ncbi:GGDEF domain-containing protein [Paractinoplanes hotanensis]|uniref:GGDEF domain-containing protein n=1 Tax=Paractinoplanes hotanensis TaxID=2906497 RepID=A0ABT0XW09_9ACTN|nr:GGDEF domain-containing protein [Actinoplanes hotanensis]MCM4077795.1 GGDEF domain-containing protein [Actinoplanes hotanensis]
MRYQLRDEQGATHSVAYLMLAAVPVVFLTGIVLPAEHPVGWVVATLLTCGFMAVAGSAARWRPGWIPRVWWLIAPFAAIAIIAGMNFASHDASAGAQLFYLWPVLYAANFLSNRMVGLVLVLISAGHAAVAFSTLTPAKALSDWISVTVALSLTAFVVGSLRNRNDRLRQVLESQALADPLTGVANRRSFDLELARAVTWARRGGESLALMTVDIDYFKKINDTYGHGVGDQALQVVANSLRVVARREDDLVARLGGDEFVVLLRTDRAGAGKAADEVRTVLAAVDGLPCGPPELSIGVAVLPDHAGTPSDLQAASDAALYEAKQGGRGRTAMARPPAPRQGAGRHNEISAAG